MATPRVLVLRAPGTNCDQESAFAFDRAGGRSELVHINRLLENPHLAGQYQIICLPGGFSYGDDVAAGRILANLIRHHLNDTFQAFRDAGKLLLGICNGFQILIKSGLLLPDDAVGQVATLTWNDSGKFEDRWVRLRVDGRRCVFLSGIESLYLPVAHAEGKFVVRDETTLEKLAAAGQLPLRYASSEGHKQARFPENPNGSQADVAGVCDPTGRVFGLMPHPERFLFRTQHPRWTREDLPDNGDGFRVFQNAVAFFAD